MYKDEGGGNKQRIRIHKAQSNETNEQHDRKVRVNAWVDPSRRKKAKLDVGEKGNIIQRGARVSGDTNSALAVVEPL